MLLIYFVFHSIYGEKGLISYIRLNGKLQKSITNFEDLRMERLDIEHKVKLLRSESLDPDMLDEYVRRNLGVAPSRETVFTVDKRK
jgi:cell division protein FtsB